MLAKLAGEASPDDPTRNIAQDIARAEVTAGGRRIKILVVIPTLDVGGAEMGLARNLPLLDRNRFEITVCTFLDRGALAARLIGSGIEVVGPFEYPTSRWLSRQRRAKQRIRQWAVARWAEKLTVGRMMQPVSLGAYAYLAWVRPLARHMRERRYDVVHTVLPISYLCGMWANRAAGRKPLIMTRASLNWYQETSRLLGYLERRFLHPRVAAVICNSAMIMRQLETEGVPRAKICLIYNGIDFQAQAEPLKDRRSARERLSVEQNALVLTSVGNLWTYKGHADLLRALHEVAPGLPAAWTLLVVGRDVDGNLARLSGLCGELNLAGHVRFLGERTDVSLILSAADMHVSASHTEGLPNNVLEAMASRLPVVATAVGGVPELVVDRETGLLVAPRDCAALGAAVLALANDPELREQMGRAGYERAATSFSLRRSVEALADVYAAAAANNSDRERQERLGTPVRPQPMQQSPAE